MRKGKLFLKEEVVRGSSGPDMGLKEIIIADVFFRPTSFYSSQG